MGINLVNGPGVLAGPVKIGVLHSSAEVCCTVYTGVLRCAAQFRRGVLYSSAGWCWLACSEDVLEKIHKHVLS